MPNSLCKRSIASRLVMATNDCVTGTHAQIHDLCTTGFHVPGLDVPTESDGDIPHTTKVVLVDAQNRIRGYYDTDADGLDEVFNRAQHVLKEARSGNG